MYHPSTVGFVYDILEGKSMDFQWSLTLKERFELHLDESKGIKGQVSGSFFSESLSFCYHSS